MIRFWKNGQFRAFASTGVLSAAMVVFGGCQPPDQTEVASDGLVNPVSDDHGHDHEGHDHEGHDHDGHDHGDHDHGKINAADMGLDADALVHLDEPDPPASLAEAVEKLAGMKTRIAAGFAADDVDSIHDELHDIGTVLEQTEELVDASDMDADQKKQAAQAVESLFEAFGSVDAKLHGETGSDYSEVASKIDEAVSALEGMKL